MAEAFDAANQGAARKSMKIIATMPVRNEAWCVAPSIRVAMKWCDEIVVLNHCSVDGTADILQALKYEFDGRLHVMNEPDPVWNEAAYRQRLLAKARERGATHVALVDADEMLTANLVPLIRPGIEHMAPATCLMLRWLCLWRSVTKYRSDDSEFGRAMIPVVFRDAPQVSYESRAGYPLHTRMPRLRTPYEWPPGAQGAVLHFQHASWPRLLAKQALYKMNDLLLWDQPAGEINRRYDPTVSEAGLELTKLPAAFAHPGIAELAIDAPPWQEAECQRLHRKHGAGKLAGLDLYGVV
jgi:glycosyltransferase involved in cell wall biosynthesis